MSQIIKYFNSHRRKVISLIALSIIGELNISRSQNMVTIVNNFKSFPRYWGKLSFARTSYVNGVPEVVAGGTTTGSYPIPVYYKKQIQISYMVCRYRFSAQGAWIWPPDMVEWFDPVSGLRTAKAAVSPADFGQTDSVDKKMERDIALPSNMADRLDDLRERLFELYDILFEAWANKYSTTSHDKLQSAAREFLKIFDQISEKPLRPYYNALGREWFGWLRELAQ